MSAVHLRRPSSAAVSGVIRCLGRMYQAMARARTQSSWAPGSAAGRMCSSRTKVSISSRVVRWDTPSSASRMASTSPLRITGLVTAVVLAIMEVLQSETGDPKYRPHPLLRKMVRGGLLGVKSGQGFFTYSK